MITIIAVIAITVSLLNLLITKIMFNKLKKETNYHAQNLKNILDYIKSLDNEQKVLFYSFKNESNNCMGLFSNQIQNYKKEFNDNIEALNKTFDDFKKEARIENMKKILENHECLIKNNSGHINILSNKINYLIESKTKSKK